MLVGVIGLTFFMGLPSVVTGVSGFTFLLGLFSTLTSVLAWGTDCVVELGTIAGDRIGGCMDVVT